MSATPSAEAAVTKQTVAIPDHNELLNRTRALLPLVKSFTDQHDRERDVAPEVVSALREAGLFRLFQPRRWGGYQADPRTQFEVQNLLAEVCMSTAWIQGVLGVQAFVLALMDEQAQADVWADNADTLVSSSFMPVGKVTPVDGGYRISGQWAFSSGSSHAQWAIVGGMVPPAAEGHPPSMRLFLIPRSDYEIIDTWHTFGLRGTGSNDLKVEDVFVPAYRTHQPSPGMVPTVDATHLPPLYRLPWLYMFTCSVSNVAIGGARGGLRAFIDIEKVRVSSMTGKPGREDPAVHAAAARLSAEIDTIDNQYKRHIGRMLDAINTAEAIPVPEGMMMRTQLTSGLRKLAQLVDDMQLLLGGRGIRTDSPLSRIWLDLCAARAHPGNDPGMISPVYGKALLDS